MSAALKLLINEQKLWHARSTDADANASSESGIASGNAELDAALPQRGWPRQGLVELLHSHDGIGELTLLLPLLAACSAERPLVLIAPPYIPNASVWQQRGVRLQRLHIVQCSADDSAWATERALRAGCCSVLSWLQRADDKTLRRLQLAAEGGHSLAVLLRDSKYQHANSPAALRLNIEASEAGLVSKLSIVKARGVVAGRSIRLQNLLHR
jgi:cell division inhibitor SulA